MDLEKFRTTQEALEEHKRLEKQLGYPVRDAVERHRRLLGDGYGSASSRMIEELRRAQFPEELGLTRNVLRQLRENGTLLDTARNRPAFTETLLAIQRTRIEGIQNGPLSVLAEAAKAANRSTLKIFDDLRREPETLIGLKGLSKIWNQEFYQQRGTAIETILGTHAARIASVSVMAQSTLAGLQAEQMGVALKAVASREVRANFAAEFTDFSRSYKNLFESFERSHARLLALPPLLSELPAVEYFNGAELVRTTSTEEQEAEDEYAEERLLIGEDIRAETQDALDRLLRELDPKLIQMRDGARHAIKSDNPDRVRHFITSYRELFTHILRRLSPDKEVQAWSTSKEHFENNRPTRKARLLFICRHINQEPFNVFVEKDIESALAAVNLFNRGTHEISSGFTPAQLVALEVRMESTLRFLLEIKRASDDSL